MARISESPWVYMHHTADGWQWVDDEDGGGEFIPLLRKLHLTPGVNGIRPGYYAQALAEKASQGFVVLHDPAIRSEYQARHVDQYGRASWRPVWDKAVSAGNRTLWRADREEKRAFLKSLIERGIIEMPPAEFFLVLAERQRHRARRRIGDALQPEIAAKLVKERARLKAMEAKIDTMNKPKKATRKAANG